MDSHPGSRSFAALLLLSLVALLFLLSGYVSVFGVVIPRTPPAGISAIRTTSITLDAGRVRIWTEIDATGRTPAFPPHSAHWLPWRPSLPDIKRSVWEFDNHPVVGSKALIRADIVAFPIWLPALPFVIAPILHLRFRLKRRPHPRGFSVVEITGKTTAS